MTLALFVMTSLAQFPIPALDAGPPDGGEAPWNVSNPGFPYTDVPIDVTEGTWVNVDVSPRGDTLAFDLLGDLYLLPIGGGEARALTAGPAWDIQPRFSPDGRSLAFTSDRGGGDNLWVMDLAPDAGVPTAVTSEKLRLVNSPAWSPDGRYLVGRKHFAMRRSLGAGELWLYHRAGGEGVQLTERPTDQKDVGEPAFSPDGRFVYFSQDVSPGKVFEYNKDPNGEIYATLRLDLETREVDRVLSGPGGSVRPTPSPDGKSLAFVRRVRGQSMLYVADLASGRERLVYDALDRDLQETWAIHGVSPAIGWTPDNRALVFWAQGKLWRVDLATLKATQIPFHVTGTRRVFEALRFPQVVSPEKFTTRMTRWAQVAPGGERVVFQALGKLWLKDLPNGVPRRLTAQNEHSEAYPSFSRDGKSIVYVTWDDDDLGSVRVSPATGGEGQALTTRPGHYLEPALSPDGKQVVYRAVAGGDQVSALYSSDTGLYVLPTAGGTPRRLSREGRGAHFGAGSDRVFFLTVNQEGKEDVRALKSVSLDASEPRTHATSDEATEYRVSPDGRWLLWRENFNAFVMPFPKGAVSLTASPEGKALPVAKLSKNAGQWLHWSGDSQTVRWSLGSTLSSRALKDAFGFLAGAPKSLPEPPTTGVDLSMQVPSDFAPGDVALVGARVITLGAQGVIDDGTVLVHDGRIAQVGPRAAVKVAASTRVIDVKGKTVMPGLIDVHWHGAVSDDGIVPEQSWRLLASLAFGLTTAHDPSNDTEGFFAASELQRSGQLLGPRLFSTGTIVYGAQGWLHTPLESMDDARAAIARLKAAGAFSVKSYNQPRRDQRQRLIQAAREQQMMVVPEGGSMLEQNLTQVVDGHTTVEHSVPVAKVYADVLQLWGHSRTGYTPTLGVAYGGLMGEDYWYQTTDVWADERLSRFVPRRMLDARSRRRVEVPPEEWNHLKEAAVANALSKAGVSVQLGAHGQREGLAAHWELAMLVQGGMSPLEALTAGTLSGARALGLDRDLGSLEPGKLADLVVLDRNPLEHIEASRSVRFTMLGGRLYDAATLDQLWPLQKKRARLPVERDGEVSVPGGGDALGCE